MYLKAWQSVHKNVIEDFLHFLNKRSGDYILKGGTALMMCYDLDRFSEDIDLDSRNKSQIGKSVKEFCTRNGYTYRVAKDTETVKRFMVNYGNETRPLKIEISYRNRRFDPLEYTKINGITVYNIEKLAILKEQAYMGRDKIRDLYDVVFISKNYWDRLSFPVQTMIKSGFEQKGMEQFDYLTETQNDDLIDNDKLADDIVDLFDELGIIDDIIAEDKEPTVDDALNNEDISDILCIAAEGMNDEYNTHRRAAAERESGNLQSSGLDEQDDDLLR